MNPDQTTWLDATEQARLVREREMTPLELVDAAIARIQRLNPALNAVIHQRFDEARKEAAGDDLAGGLLRGVPFLLKDLVQTVQGEPQTMGWKFFKDNDYRAPLTSYVAQKFIDAGLVRLGVTTTPEWGSCLSAETAAWGTTPNPWDLTRVAGGSSTGAAVSVASGMVPLAHGNDAGGSIRIPAAWCGLVGLKPSRGRTSLGPVYSDYLWGSAEEGVLARSVRDAALGLDVVSGNMPGDPFRAPAPVRPFRAEVGVDPGRLRVGFVPSAPPDLAPFTDDAKNALTEALSLLTSLGHDVEDSHPEVLDSEGIGTDYFRVGGSQFASGVLQLEHALGRKFTEGDFDAWTWAMLQWGLETKSVDYVAYGDWRNTMARGAGDWWAHGYDVLVMPTVSTAAPELGIYQLRPGEGIASWLSRYHGHVPYTQIWNATGQPAISLPLHMTPDGLPLGVMIVADYGREDLLLRLASQIEQAAPWHDNHPEISLTAGTVGI